MHGVCGIPFFLFWFDETKTGFGVFHTESLGNPYSQGNSLNFSMPKPSILGWVCMHQFSFGQGLTPTSPLVPTRCYGEGEVERSESSYKER